MFISLPHEPNSSTLTYVDKLLLLHVFGLVLLWLSMVGNSTIPVDLDNSGKMAKNCMKVTKSTFGSKQLLGGQANFLGSGEDPQGNPDL